MHHLMILFCLVLRAVRPARGLHTAPRAVRRDVREEARANRVRRYANPAPALPAGPGFDTATADVPRVPPPRRAPDAAPPFPPAVRAPARRTSLVVDPLSAAEPADIVRRYYRAFETSQRVRGGRASVAHGFAEAVAV